MFSTAPVDSSDTREMEVKKSKNGVVNIYSYTLGVYGVGCPTRGMVLPDHSKAVSERPPYLERSTTPKKTVTDSTPVQTGSRNMAVIQATDSSSKTSC